jgi:AcrR family transcriptional regulator
LDGLAPVAPASADSSKATRVVDDARAGWVAEAAEAAESQGQRRGQVLDAARSQFALRGFEATTMRDIADAAGITASNLYR